MQDALLNPDPCKNQMMVLKKTLSCSYPNMPFDEALQKENEKLQMELQSSQGNLDIGQCEVIQHLLGVTENIACSLPENSENLRDSKKVESDYPDTNTDIQDSVGGDYCSQQNDTYMASKSVFIFFLCLLLSAMELTLVQSVRFSVFLVDIITIISMLSP